MAKRPSKKENKTYGVKESMRRFKAALMGARVTSPVVYKDTHKAKNKKPSR